MKILISGGTGFIGKNLIKNLLLSKNVKILLITRNKKIKFNDSKITYIRNDLKNIDQYENQIINFKPEIIYFFSWTGIPDFSLKNCNINLDNSIKFLNCVQKIKSLKKIFILGTCLEYLKKYGECKETDYLDKKNLFPKTKINIYKRFSRDINKNIKLYWFRLFYVYGNGQRIGSLIPTIINSIINNKKLTLYNINKKHDYIFIDDVVNIISYFSKKKIPSGIYNVGTGKLTSNKVIYQYIKNKINFKYNNMQVINNNHNNKTIWSSNKKINKYFKIKTKSNIYKNLDQILEAYTN